VLISHSQGAPGRLERVAHRGAPLERVENTLPGFILAIERGADAVELDVHCTADGVVVVHHDDTVRGRVISASHWADLAQVDLGGGATMPRLEDVFKAIGDRAMMYVELKGARIEEPVLEVCTRAGTPFALHSFDHDAIERVAERSPATPRGALLDRGTSNPTEALRRAADRLGLRDVWPHYSLIDEALVAVAGEAGVRLIAWTVNSAETASWLSSRGVDAICTDDVRLLANLEG
jgi:glycerophosphoryl diester phosphodiesterase